MSLNNTQNLRLGGYSNGHYLNNSFTNNQNSNNNSFFNSTDNISKLLNQNKSPFNMVDISIDDNMDCNIKPNANLLCVSNNNNNNNYQQSNSFSSGSNFQLRQPIIKMPPHLQQQQQQPQNNYQKVPMLDFSFKQTNNQPMKTTMPAYMQPNTSSPQYQPNQYQKSHDNYNHGDNLVGYRPNNFLKNPSQPESYYRRLNHNGIEEHHNMQSYNHLNQYKLDGLHLNNNYQQNSPKNYNNNQYQQNYNENNYSSGQQHLKFSPKLNSDHKFYQPKPLSNPTKLNVNGEATRKPDLIFESSKQEYTVEEIQNQVDYYYEKSFKNLTTKNEADLKDSQNSKTELLVVKTEDETRLTSHLRSQTVETIDLNGHKTRENEEELHQSAYHHHSRNPEAESPQQQQQQQTPVAQVRSRRSSLSSTTMPNCFSIATADINIDVDHVDSEKTDSSSAPHRPFTKPRVSNINPLSYYETRVKNEPELIVSPVLKEEEAKTIEEVMNSIPSAKPRLKPNQLNETTKLIQELSDASDEGIQMSSDINDSEKINEEKVEKKVRINVAKPRSKSTPNPLPKPRNSVRLDNEKYNSDDETDSNEAGYCEENLDDDYKHDDQLNYIDTSTSTISSEHNVKPNHPRQVHVVNQALVDNNQQFINSDNSIDITDLPKKSAKFITTENDVRKKLDLNLASCLNRNNYTSPDKYTMNENSEKSNNISSSTSSSSRSSELEPSLSPRSESNSSSQHAVSNSSSTVSSPSHSTSNFSQQSSQHFKSVVHSPNKHLNNINEIEPSQNNSSSGGVVNQIKNMFEVAKPLQRNDILLSPSPAKPALRKFNVAASPTTTKQEIITTPKLQAKRVEEEEEKPEYMNLSNNYIARAKPKETKRALPPPPTSPPLPPTQPPISPNYKINNNFEIESLQSSPTKHVNKQSSPTKHQTAKTTENLVSKLISNSPINQFQRPKNAPVNIQTELNSETLNQQAKAASPLASTVVGHTSRQQRQMSSASSNTNYTLQSVKITPNASTNGGALTEFRVLNAHSSERSNTPSGKSSNTSMANIVDRRVMIRHIPEAVDEVKLDFEGQRRVVVPGYMTSADILRNMLLNNANNNANMSLVNGTDLKTAAPMIIKRQQQNGMSLKEKLLMQKRIEAGENVDDLNHQYRDDSLLSSRHKQNYSMAQMNPSHRLFNGNLTTQQHMSKSIHFNEANSRNGFNQDPAANLKSSPRNEDDDDLAKKFRSNRTRSMSGIITINTTSTQIIDINLDYETAPASNQQAPQTITKIEEKPPAQPPVKEELKAAPRNAAKMSNEQKIFQSINQPIIYAPVPPPPPPPPAPVQQNKSLEIASYSISTQKPQENLPVVVVSQAPRANKQLDPENHYAVSHIIADNPVQTKFSTVEQQQQLELRTSSVKNSINGSRRIAKQSVTGSFDPNDFDSFDEEEEDENSGSKRSTRSLMRNQAQINARVPNHVQIESIEKIRESAMIQNVELEPEQEQQQGMGPGVESSNLNAVQFDPDYFDSFDEDESDTEKRTSSPINAQLPVIQLSPKNETQTQHVNNRSSEEPEIMDEQKKRQSEFIANRNKLEEIFKRNAGFNTQTKPKEPSKEKPVVKTTPISPLATNSTENHPKINLGDLNTQETSDYNAEISSQINSSTNYNDNVSNYSNERQNNTVTSPKLNNKNLNNFIEEAEDAPQSHSSNFFRSALDRLSNRNSKKSKSKSRSSSVPLRTLIANELKASTNISIEQDEYAEQEIEMARKTQRSRTLQYEETSVVKNFGSTTLPASQSVLPNMKALHLMTKMQNEFEEKQKRKKQRREQQKLLEEQKKQNTELNKSQSEIKTPKSERKFLTSIINTLFSTSSNNNEASSASNETNFQKNEAKRLSLRKLKAKDKAKRKGDDGEPNAGDKDQDYQSDGEINNSTKKFNIKKASNQSLNIIMNYQNDDFDNEDDVVEHTDEFKLKSTVDEATHNNIMPSTSKLQARFGKIKNETKEETPINPNNKENIMKQLKAELDEEIKDRRLIELKENIINGGCESSSGGSTNSGASAVISNYDDNYAKNPKSSTLNRRRNNANFENNGDDLDKKNRKNRSKSVTFLDEISTDDEQLAHSPNNYQKRPMDFTGLDKNYTTNNVSSPQIQPRTSTSNNGYYEDNEESNNHLVTPSSNRRSLKNGDARLYAGALTGVGPIRSIMKKSATDLAISVNMNSTNYDDSEGVNSNEAANYLPNVQMGAYEQDYNRMPKSQTTPNFSAKKKQLIQSDL